MLLRRSRASLVAVATGVALVAGLGLAEPPGASGATKRRATTKKTVRPNFDFSFVSDEQTVTAGGKAVYTFTMRSQGNIGGVVFELPNISEFLNARVLTQSATRMQLEINVPPFVPAHSGVFILRGRSGSGLVRQALFRLNVNAAPTTTIPPTTAAPVPAVDFGVSVADPNKSAFPGSAVQYTIAIERKAGATAPVGFEVQGLPTATNARFDPTPATGASTQLTLTPSETTPSGTYLLTVLAKAGSTTKATAVMFVVRRTGDFGLAVAPATATTGAGNDAVVAVNVTPPRGATAAPDVEFTANGLPTGVTAIFTPNPTNGLTQLRLATLPTAAAGTYNVTVVGTSGRFSRAAPLQLTVRRNVPGFGLQAQPVTASVEPSQIATYTVTINPTGGFTGEVALAVRGLPPGAGATVERTANSATVRVATAASTPTGTFPLELVGTSGSLQATVKVELVVRDK